MVQTFREGLNPGEGFNVKSLGLIIEIDGNSNNNKKEYDAQRQAYLEGLESKMYCEIDCDVKQHLKTVMMGSEDFISKEFGLADSIGTNPPGVHK